MTNKSCEAKIKQLQEKVTKSFDHYAVSFEVDGRYSPSQWVEEVFQTFKDAGYYLIPELKILEINEWLALHGIDRAYKKDMKSTYETIKEDLQAQRDYDLKQIKETL